MIIDHRGKFILLEPTKNATEQYFVHRFPRINEPVRLVVFDIADNNIFMRFDGENSSSRRRPQKVTREARKTEIRAMFSQPIRLFEIQVPYQGGPIRFFGKPFSVLDLNNSYLIPSEVELSCYYEKKHKRKVVNAVYLTNECPPPNANVALARFDHFYACDANTWEFVGTGKVSICVAFRGDLEPVKAGHRELKYGKTCVIEMAGEVVGNPELLATKALICEIQLQLASMPLKPIGIVIDSDLGKIKEINSRRLPLIDDYYLPQGFELMYASDATGTTEFFANLLIRKCDKASTDLLLAYQTTRGLARAVS